MRDIATLCRLAISRLLARPGILLVRLVGLTAVTLVSAAWLASVGVGDAMLHSSVRADPRSSYLQVSQIATPLTAAAYESLDSYTQRGLAADLGLSLQDRHVHDYTGTAPVYRLGRTSLRRDGLLSHLPLHYYEGFQDNVWVMEGSLDHPKMAQSGDAPVAITSYTAQSLHLSVGDRLIYAMHHGQVQLSPPMVVVAIVEPRDGSSVFWGDASGIFTYRSLIILSKETFISIATNGDVFSPDYFWSYTIDPTAIQLADAPALLARIQRVDATLSVVGSGAALFTSLQDDLTQFLQQYELLPFILLLLVTPILALILYAIAVISALVFDQQTGELVLLYNRGAATLQVVILQALECLILGIVAVIVGPFLALPMGRAIGGASGFLSFSGGLPFEVRVTGQLFLIAALTAVLGMTAALVPALSRTRRPISSFKQTQSRSVERPLWQKLALDMALLAVALYGLTVLIHQGPITASSATSAIAQDPMIAIAPLVFTVAIALMVSHILPWLARTTLLMLGRTVSPSVYMALLGLVRTPREPRRLVALCTLTLTLGVFVATVAGVEANNIHDNQLYQAGCDLRLEEFSARQETIFKKETDIMPLALHRTLPGVRAVSPALRFETSGNIINTVNGTDVTVLGVDPTTAGGVMWFRPDFASQSLPQLLAVLHTESAGAIVSDSFAVATGLRSGDSFDVMLSNNTAVHLHVAAIIRYFPSLDPTQMPFVVTNLTYLQETSGAFGPNEVWMSTNHNRATFDQIVQITNGWPRQVLSYQGVAAPFSAQAEPLTAGIYGVVSGGFLVAGALALLGFFVYAYLSYQKRLTEFAIVRAMGISPHGVRWLLLCEQFVLLGAGVGGGIIAGTLTTVLFLPYLPFATQTIPPFLVAVPWATIGTFIVSVLAIFAGTLSLQLTVVVRLPVGRTLRLGEG